MSLSQNGPGVTSGVDVDPASAPRNASDSNGHATDSNEYGAAGRPNSQATSAGMPVPEGSPTAAGRHTGPVKAQPAPPAFTSTPIYPSAADAATSALALGPNARTPGAQDGIPTRGVPAPPAGPAAPGRSATSVPPAGRGQRGARARGPRRARLQLRHIDAWTVLKFSCVLSLALFFVWLIVVGVLFGVLDASGIIAKINDSIITLNGGNPKPPITAGIVFGGAAIIGVVNIVLFIAITTIGSVVYNLCADLVGGIEVTLSER